MSVEEIKREAIHIRSALSSAYGSKQQLNSPDKIDDHILKDFKNRSKPIKLITTDKNALTSKIIFFDSEYLYVRVPPNFKPSVGSLMIIQFPSDDGGSILQSYVHKVSTPILCLKFLDPRKDTRHSPIAKNVVNYTIIDEDINWLNDKKFYIIRLGEDVKEEKRKIIVRDTIGSKKSTDKSGKPFFVTHENHVDDLKRQFKQSQLFDISLGGLSITCGEKNLEKHSLVYTNITIGSKDASVEEIELSLFGIVCNIFPVSEDSFRCGISFINRVVIDSIDDFLKEINTYNNHSSDE